MWVWETDKQAIADAQKELNDFQTEEAIREIEKQIEAWEEYKDTFTKIPNEYQKAQDKLKAEMLLGYNWEEDVINKRIGLQEKLKNAYVDTMTAIENLDEAIRNQVDNDVGLTEKDGSNWRAIVALNSEKWKISTDPAEKAALHNANVQIYREHGYEYDPATGTYYKVSSSGSSGGSSGTIKSNASNRPGKITTVVDSNGNIVSGGTAPSSSGSSSGSGASSAISKFVGTTIGKAISDAVKKATQKSSYSSGGVNDETGVAMLHGTKSRSEVIFNSADAKKLWDYIHNMNIEKIRSNIKPSLMPNFKAFSPAIQPISEDNSITIQNLTVKANDANTLIQELKLLKNNR